MTYRITNSNNLKDIFEVYEFIKDLNNYYPNFNNWYWDKVVPGVMLNQDKIIIARKKFELVGVSIIKKGLNENKLRALRISKRLQNKGTSLTMRLIDESFKQLNDSYPNFSIAEELMSNLSRIFVNRYNAKLDYVYNSLYRKGICEYSFNEKKNLKIKTWY